MGGPFPAPEDDVDCTAHVEGNTATVKLEGRFTFEAQAGFRAATLPLLEVAGLRQVRLELSGLTCLDASALGALLLLRERTEAKGQQVILEGPTREVRDLLAAVNFEKLFVIE
ncbi:MAG: STAS domain protein [Acidobacteria bacterium ADurb.Bin340]|jgi:anti-anti-sigma factor|nr:MAG: STAS domain protein [Acidobacteria bacterium ADurb.Bin340]HOD33003.1 STAS domain-containing protein [Holophaga sp.]